MRRLVSAGGDTPATKVSQSEFFSRTQPKRTKCKFTSASFTYLTYRPPPLSPILHTTTQDKTGKPMYTRPNHRHKPRVTQSDMTTTHTNRPHGAIRATPELRRPQLERGFRKIHGRLAPNVSLPPPLSPILHTAPGRLPPNVSLPPPLSPMLHTLFHISYIQWQRRRRRWQRQAQPNAASSRPPPPLVQAALLPDDRRGPQRRTHACREPAAACILSIPPYEY